MENPSEKKRFPWGWVAAGCSLIAVLAVAAVLVVMFVVLPVFRNATAQNNPVTIPLPAPLIGATPVPTQGSSSGTTINDLPFSFNQVQDPSVLTNQSLMDQMVTSLNLNNDTDFMAPKTYQGSITLDPTTSFTIGNGWCAKDATTLSQNLAKMQFQLSINGTNIDLSQYPTINFTDGQGHACAMTGIQITPSGNTSGTFKIVLTQKFLSSLSDGITTSPYPAGDVTFDFNVKFQGGLNPGNNT